MLKCSVKLKSVDLSAQQLSSSAHPASFPIFIQFVQFKGFLPHSKLLEQVHLKRCLVLFVWLQKELNKSVCLGLSLKIVFPFEPVKKAMMILKTCLLGGICGLLELFTARSFLCSSLEETLEQHVWPDNVYSSCLLCIYIWSSPHRLT